ncbi:MAG TPA: hypothetical protein VF945_02825, partial [Polyangia bacterium]
RPSLILVGSSMGAVLPPAALPSGSYNLALSSFGAQTGLAIVARSRQRPQQVLIEANVTALLPPAEDLVASLFEPVTFALQRSLAVARHDHQPMALVDETLRRWSARGKKDSDYVLPPALLAKRVGELVAQQAAWRATPTTAAALDHLAAQVRALEEAGTRVIFFECPMDERLLTSAQTEGVRALLRERFSPERYQWISLEDWASFHTSDGLHLIPESAERFARRLRDEIERRSQRSTGM